MAEKEGFEPPRRRRPPGFQDRSLQPDLGISPRFFQIRIDYIITIYIKSTFILLFLYILFSKQNKKSHMRLNIQMVPKVGLEPTRGFILAGF